MLNAPPNISETDLATLREQCSAHRELPSLLRHYQEEILQLIDDKMCDNATLRNDLGSSRSEAHRAIAQSGADIRLDPSDNLVTVECKITHMVLSPSGTIEDGVRLPPSPLAVHILRNCILPSDKFSFHMSPHPGEPVRMCYDVLSNISALLGEEFSPADVPDAQKSWDEIIDDRNYFEYVENLLQILLEKLSQAIVSKDRGYNFIYSFLECSTLLQWLDENRNYLQKNFTDFVQEVVTLASRAKKEIQWYENTHMQKVSTPSPQLVERVNTLLELCERIAPETNDPQA